MTTWLCRIFKGCRLWFAQNSLPLWLKWQPDCVASLTVAGCDLLKIHYLCGWNDNFTIIFKYVGVVVICSKFITFVVEMTTHWERRHYIVTLWFAQNSLPLWLKWQHTGRVIGRDCVVICSKFITFVVEMTTYCRGLTGYLTLWFAQNSLPLWLKWQHYPYTAHNLQCCDLLKIHYLCGWNDNSKIKRWYMAPVVICSKFITFVVEMTT